MHARAWVIVLNIWMFCEACACMKPINVYWYAAKPFFEIVQARA